MIFTHGSVQVNKPTCRSTLVDNLVFPNLGAGLKDFLREKKSWFCEQMVHNWLISTNGRRSLCKYFTSDWKAPGGHRGVQGDYTWCMHENDWTCTQRQNQFLALDACFDFNYKIGCFAWIIHCRPEWDLNYVLFGMTRNHIWHRCNFWIVINKINK